MVDVTFNFSDQRMAVYTGRVKVPLYQSPYTINATLPALNNFFGNGYLPCNFLYRQQGDIPYSLSYRHLTPFSETLGFLGPQYNTVGNLNSTVSLLYTGSKIMGFGKDSQYLPGNLNALYSISLPIKQAGITVWDSIVKNVFAIGVNFSIGYSMLASNAQQMIRHNLWGKDKAIFTTVNRTGLIGEFYTVAQNQRYNDRSFPSVYNSASVRFKGNAAFDRLEMNCMMCGLSTATRPRLWYWKTKPLIDSVETIAMWEVTCDNPLVDANLAAGFTCYPHPYGWLLSGTGLVDGLPAWFFLSDDGTYIFQIEFVAANFTPIGSFMTNGWLTTDAAGTIYRTSSFDPTHVFTSLDPTYYPFIQNARSLEFKPPFTLPCVPCNMMG